MIYEQIEYQVRASLGRNEWVILIYYPHNAYGKSTTGYRLVSDCVGDHRHGLFAVEAIQNRYRSPSRTTCSAPLSSRLIRYIGLSLTAGRKPTIVNVLRTTRAAPLGGV